MRNAKIIASAALAAMAVSGCAYKEMMASADADHAERGATISEKRKTIVPNEPRPLVTHTKVSWVGRKNVPLSREAVLPPVFSTNVTMIFPGRVNLRAAAERLNKVTGIPVHLKPDVFMPTSGFIGSAGGVMPQAGLTNLPALPPPNGLPALPPLSSSIYTPVMNTADEIEVNYTGPLVGFLNQMSSRFGINWEYTNENGISFSRLVTKTFVVKANPGDSSFTASLGKGGSGGVSGAYSSDGQVKMNSSFSVWEGIQKSLETIKSPVGKYSISQATGSVTITDTRDVVEMAKSIIDSENDMLTKQVAIRLDMYSVSSTDDVEAGMDWNVVYQKFSQGVADWSLKVVSPATVTSNLAGSLGMSILNPVTTGTGIDALSGSEALFRVMQGVGKVSRVQSVSAMTLNRQPVPIGVTSQISYLARTTPGTTGTGATTLPGLEPGQVTTGFLTNLLPTVLDSNSILLQFSIDLSELRKIGIISTGQGATQQSIQTPEVDAVQFVQRVALRPGSTLVLTGYERDRNGYDQRGLTKDVGMGGNVVGKRTRESVIIMLTPSLVDGAN